MNKPVKYIGSVVLLILIALFILFKISKSRTFQVCGKIVAHTNTTQKVVALTFDDGPTPYTAAILETLTHYHVPATFFFTGQEMEHDPAIVKQVIVRGYAIGNHTYSHKRMLLKSWNFIQREIEHTDNIISSLGYKGTIYFRPPYCKKLFLLPYYLKQTNRTTVTWNIEPDSRPGIDAKDILEDIQQNIKPGSIILLHAMYNNRKATREALPYIIQWLQSAGYTIVPLDTIVNLR